MRAIVIHKAKDLRIEPIEVAAPAAGEVQIRMAMGGICGSDLHYYNHGGFGTIQVREPMILGHEVSGFISALGAGVDDFDIGDLVAVSPSRPCGQCWFCENDQQIHCGTAAALASGIAAMRPRGVLIQLGLGGDMCVPMQAVTAKELEIRGSFRFHEEFKQAVHFMQQVKIDVKPIISHVFGIEDAVQGFEIANDRRQAMKAQIRFS